MDTAVSNDDVTIPAEIVARDPPPPHTLDNETNPTATETVTNAANSLHIPPPQYILIGDSIVRHVAIPDCITYSFSGAKIKDLITHIPDIIQLNQSAHSVIVHIGLNDIKSRSTQSADLRNDYEALANLIESLNKKCLFSGLLPTIHNHSELFSRLFSADNWIRNFCVACGYGYVDNFDSFWKIPTLFYDKIHLNNKGKKILATNIATQLSRPSEPRGNT